MDFKSAAARVRDMVAQKKPGSLSTSALAPEPLRDNIIREAEQRSERFRNHANQTPLIEYERTDDEGNTTRDQHAWTTYPSAVRDIARAGFGYDEPKLLRPDQMRPSHRLNREVEQQFFASEDFREARPYTRGNPIESLFGAMAAAGSLKESAKGVLAEHVARSQEMEQAEQQIDDADRLLENLREQAKRQKREQGKIDPNVAQQVKDATGQRQQARANLKRLMDEHAQSGSVAAAAQAARTAAEAHNDAVALVSELPGSGEGLARNTDVESQLALAEKWRANETLRRLAHEMGRMVRDLRFKRQARTRNVPVQPVGITTGRHLERQLPHELARAFMPELRPVWIKDYAENSLLESQMEGYERAGKGPLVCVDDESGSMGVDFGGVPRRIWAKSLCIALATLANREKRAFAGIGFGSAREVRTWLFPAGEPIDPEGLLDYGSHFFGGGTNIRAGLAQALRVIREHGEFESADVVLIGDGQDRFTPDDQRVLDELRALNVRVHGISIACPNNAYMRQACEYTIDVGDVAAGGEAVSALAENIT